MEGNRGKGRPRKKRIDIIKDDMRKCRVNKDVGRRGQRGQNECSRAWNKGDDKEELVLFAL